jgi:hypothetical protein
MPNYTNISKGMNFWIDSMGRNNLKGVPGDSSNPPILPNDQIWLFLNEYADARKGYREIVSLLLPEEQERLQAIIDSCPNIMDDDKLYDQDYEDKVQKRLGGTRVNIPTSHQNIPRPVIEKSGLIVRGGGRSI